MPSEEPIETHVAASAQPDNADAAWRAEVASRVYSYQARRRRRYAGESAPALDFGPATEAETFGAEPPQSQRNASANVRSSAEPARTGRDTSSNPVRNPVLSNRTSRDSTAIDTNYYRRLNAESMAHGSSIAPTEADVAIAPAPEYEVECQEFSGDDASDPALHQTTDADVTTEPMSEAAMHEADRDPVPTDPALDSAIRPILASDDSPCVSAEHTPAATLQGNLIVFPRPVLEPPLLPQPSRDELAEPMNRRPRILEVPEDIMPVVQGSLFPEIRLDGDMDEHAANREPEIEVPLRVAPVSSRMMAALTDGAVTIAAGLLFAGMAWHALPGIPHTKPFWMMLGAVTLLLWAIYQHLFLLYAGRTLGMSTRGIRLSTFDGQTPPWAQRRRRARFMVISFAAVTLGFLWALVDEDALCWHDRISQTFPTAE